MQVRIFSPRRQPTQLEVNPAETFGAIRARLGKEFGIAELSGVAGGRGLILHHGETVRMACPLSYLPRLLCIGKNEAFAC